MQNYSFSDKKVALVHDFLLYQGGAEKVFEEISSVFPEAPVFTLSQKKRMVRKFEGRKVIPSFLGKLSLLLPHRWLLPFYPLTAESIDLREYDLVISSTSSFMKGIVVKPKTLHICYCHTPTRYLWDWHSRYLDESFSSPVKKILTSALMNYLRMWDRMAAERVDLFVANSKFTAERIKKYYNKPSELIYPPVDVDKFTVKEKTRGYFLVVSRLSPYKRIDLVVEAFNKLGWPLIVVGEGKEKKKLEKSAEKNIRFLGYVGSKRLAKLYAACRAFIFPGLDDFGITMVEAMASGRPVIAFRGGGALEIVEEGKTGEFFNSHQPEIFIDTLRRFKVQEKEYSPEYIRKSAKKFSKQKFHERFREFLKKAGSNTQLSLLG